MNSPTPARHAGYVGLAALVVSVVAALLSATIWLSLLGAPLGLVGLALAFVALRRARASGRRSWTGGVAAALSALAALALPFFLWACNSWLSCV